MSNVEMKNLEEMLGILSVELNGIVHITSPVIQDGYTIGIFPYGGGDLIKSASGPTIESVIKKLKP